MFWIFNLIFDNLATVLATFLSIGRIFQSSGPSGWIYQLMLELMLNLMPNVGSNLIKLTFLVALSNEP
jgi:hypothetical protein